MRKTPSTPGAALPTRLEARHPAPAGRFALVAAGVLLLAGLAAPLAASTRLSGEAHPFSDVSFTTTLPKISPDGAYAVYRQDAVTDGAFDLWSVRLDGTSAPVRLSQPLIVGQGQFLTFAISPDSSWVVYSVDQDVNGKLELYSTPIGGGPITKLNPSLADDRDVAAFEISATSDNVVFSCDRNRWTKYELFSVPIDGPGALAVQLNATIGFDDDVEGFLISPNGNTVVYRAGNTDSDEWDLFAVPTEGGEAAQISRNLPNGSGVPPTFKISPNGATVVYLADPIVDGSFEIYSVPIGGGDSTQLNPTPVSGGSVDLDFLISADSTRVVYRADQVTDESYQLYSVPIGGGTATRLNGPLAVNEDVEAGFVISANNARVVYRSDEDVTDVIDAYSVPLTGGTPTKLNPTPVSGGDVLDVAVSNNSTRVVYIADQNVDTLNELFSVPLAGGTAVKLNRTLASGGDVQNFKISPNSDWVIYGADQDVDTVDELLGVPIAGGTVVDVNGPLVSGGDVVLKIVLTPAYDISPTSGLDVLYGADETTNDKVDLYVSTLTSGPPGAPTGVSATPGNHLATVTFAAPTSNGGSPITGYTVTSSPPGGVDSNAGSTSLSHTVTGLTNGTSYTFTVRATNVNGQGPASAPSAPVTPATTPDAPTGVTATAWHQSASVSFSPPVDNGGSPITGYTVTSSPAGGVDIDAGSTALTHQMVSLANGTPYSFTVKATNAVGQGAASAPSSPVTPNCGIFCDGFELSNTQAWTPLPSLSVVKSVTSTGPYNLGDTIGYSIAVTNTGFITLTSVTVIDPGAVLGACTPAQPASLDPGATMSCPATHVVTQPNLDSGSYLNTATGDSAETAPANGGVTVTFPTANLAVTVTDGAANEIPGTPVTYTLSVSNAGPDAAPSVTVTDLFDAALSSCSTTCVATGGASCAAGPLLGNLNTSASLPNGGLVTYTSTCAVASGATGNLSNTATATLVGVTDPNLANNTATDVDTLVRHADLAITNSNGASVVTAGSNTTYTIVASNAGPSDAPAAVIIDIFPSACTSITWTCNGAAGGSCNAGASGSIYESVNLPVGGSVTFSALCSISGAATGTISNTATAVDSGATDANPSNNSATDVDVVTLPS